MYDDSAIVDDVLVDNRPKKASELRTDVMYRGMYTFPDRIRCPWSRPMTKSLPKLPMNEG